MNLLVVLGPGGAAVAGPVVLGLRAGAAEDVVRDVEEVRHVAAEVDVVWLGLLVVALDAVAVEDPLYDFRVAEAFDAPCGLFEFLDLAADGDLLSASLEGR